MSGLRGCVPTDEFNLLSCISTGKSETAGKVMKWVGKPGLWRKESTTWKKNSERKLKPWNKTRNTNAGNKNSANQRTRRHHLLFTQAGERCRRWRPAPAAALLVCLPIAVIEHRQNKVEKGRVYFHLQLQLFPEGSQGGAQGRKRKGRKREAGTKARTTEEAPHWLASLAYIGSVYFLIEPRSPCPGVTAQCAGPFLPHHSTIKKTPHRRAHRAIPQRKFPGVQADTCSYAPQVVYSNIQKNQKETCITRASKNSGI